MHNYIGMKLKRKDLEEVNDDFSDFSLSSPARKIRRLGSELPPIMEEEREFPLEYEHSVSEGDVEEKAIVPFKPMNGLLIHSPSSYSVDPNLISSFKNQAFLGAHLYPTRPSEDDDLRRNGDDHEVNTCRAVIPWVPSSEHQLNDQRPAVVSSQPEVSESMDSEEMEGEAMEIEDGAPNFAQRVSEYISHPIISEGLQQQWQQQHCMIPQPPQNITTPIVWYR